MGMDSTARDGNYLADSYLMDSFGRSLLTELQENARLSTAELARRVGLSPTATAERLKQMEEMGIVRGYTVEMDREALGLEVLAFIRMTCDGQHYFRLMEFVQTLEEVRECHHLTGGDAFLLKVTTASMSALETLIEALLPYGNPVTSVVLSTPVERRKYTLNGKSGSKLTSAAKKRRVWTGRR
jgi:Lrp/AsnC family leucine-responsive transcriptional regulator